MKVSKDSTIGSIIETEDQFDARIKAQFEDYELLITDRNSTRHEKDVEVSITLDDGFFLWEGTSYVSKETTVEEAAASVDWERAS